MKEFVNAKNIKKSDKSQVFMYQFTLYLDKMPNVLQTCHYISFFHFPKSKFFK